MDLVAELYRVAKLISVIISVYNSENFIEQCVRSVMKQTYKDLEIIAVDDGSPDSSGIICDKLAKEDNRIVVIHQPNGGASAAQNAGIERAKGDYLVFLDGDDYISPLLIERLYVTLQENNADMVICDQILFEGDFVNEEKPQVGARITRYNIKEAIIELIKDETIHNYAFGRLFKHKLFDDIRFPIGIKYDDVYIMHRVFAKCSSIIYLPETLYFYRQHEGSILHNRTLDLSLDQYEAYQEQRKKICAKWPDLEAMIDERDYPYLISTILYYYKDYAGDGKYKEKIELIKAELKECRKRIKMKKRCKLKDAINYFRALYLKPLIRRQ